MSDEYGHTGHVGFGAVTHVWLLRRMNINPQLFTTNGPFIARLQTSISSCKKGKNRNIKSSGDVKTRDIN